MSTTILGYPSRVSIAPIQLFLGTDHLDLVPVSSFYRSADEVCIVFHAPVQTLPPSSSGLPLPQEARQTVDRVLTCLTDELRLRAPYQVVPRYLPHRERPRART